jgi:GH15 family glucan-1,4-alpha-glucosidase
VYSDSIDYSAIADYGLIGNCRSAALVSRQGSLDWLCWPRYDSPSLFGALLDARRGGCFRVAPAGVIDVSRRYLGESAVLETTFRTRTGVARLLDLMPVADEAARADELWPDHELLRQLECLQGEVEAEVRFAPRFDYGAAAPRLRPDPAFGILCGHGSQVLSLTSERPLRVEADGATAVGRACLRAGETWTLSLAYNEQLPAILPPWAGDAAAHIDRTVAWWTRWMQSCTYEGPWAPLVRRSAITLKLLTYSPSGALVAAPTTSLPEAIGGVRNWDYRYCWLRDASMMLRALFDVGLMEEGEAFLSWLLHSTRLTWPELQILYDVFGGTRLPERTLDHLEGYAGSAPVRIGNAATNQLQLDIYGEVAGAAWAFVERGGALDRRTARMLVGLGHTVIRRWREPDEGIWEPRTRRSQHTHSKAMCWVALDRLARLVERGQLPGPTAEFLRERDQIRCTIEREGVGAAGHYVSEFGGDTVDASLLLLSLLGYADPRSARMRATVAAVRDRLGANGLLYRYRTDETADGLPGGEGAFGLCGFWAVGARMLEGDVAGARADFEHLLTFANDLGLFAEQYDPATGTALGNFPQAFTHVGVINAAVDLARAEGLTPVARPVGALPDADDMRGRV